MKIGVAIPCYSGHIPKLLCLLNSLEKQTKLPDKVVVSCSSIHHELNYSGKYSFAVHFNRIKQGRRSHIAGVKSKL